MLTWKTALTAPGESTTITDTDDAVEEMVHVIDQPTVVRFQTLPMQPLLTPERVFTLHKYSPPSGCEMNPQGMECGCCARVHSRLIATDGGTTARREGCVDVSDMDAASRMCCVLPSLRQVRNRESISSAKHDSIAICQSHVATRSTIECGYHTHGYDVPLQASVVGFFVSIPATDGPCPTDDASMRDFWMVGSSTISCMNPFPPINKAMHSDLTPPPFPNGMQAKYGLPLDAVQLACSSTAAGLPAYAQVRIRAAKSSATDDDAARLFVTHPAGRGDTGGADFEDGGDVVCSGGVQRPGTIATVHVPGVLSAGCDGPHACGLAHTHRGRRRHRLALRGARGRFAVLPRGRLPAASRRCLCPSNLTPSR